VTRALALAIGLGIAISGAGAQTHVTAITRATVLDGRGSAPRANTTVIVADGAIRSVQSDGHVPASADVIDAHGGDLLPGFIDMHAHLMFPQCAPGPDGSIFDRAVSERMLSALLDFGITTVRSPATPTVAGLHQEFELLADAGVPARDILQMTGNNAALALRQADIGAIEAGRRADLVLLNASPLANIRNTRRIVWVMKQGALVSRGAESLKGEGRR
jgi:imidazolonepropionase-like amidohydrolase